MELKNVSDFMELYFIKAIGKMIWISLFTNIDIYIFQARNCSYKNSTVNLVLILISFSSFMDYKKKPCISIHQMDTFFWLSNFCGHEIVKNNKSEHLWSSNSQKDVIFWHEV